MFGSGSTKCLNCSVWWCTVQVRFDFENLDSYSVGNGFARGISCFEFRAWKETATAYCTPSIGSLAPRDVFGQWTYFSKISYRPDVGRTVVVGVPRLLHNIKRNDPSGAVQLDGLINNTHIITVFIVCVCVCVCIVHMCLYKPPTYVYCTTTSA